LVRFGEKISAAVEIAPVDPVAEKRLAQNVARLVAFGLGSVTRSLLTGKRAANQ
jgi:hypothetical protein